MTKFNPIRNQEAQADSIRYRAIPWALADVSFAGGIEPRLQVSHIQRAANSNPIERSMMEIQKTLTTDLTTNEQIATFLASEAALGLTYINARGAANRSWDIMTQKEFRRDRAASALIPSAELTAALLHLGTRIGSAPEVQRAWENGLSVSIDRASAAKPATRTPAWTRPTLAVPSAQQLTIAYTYAIMTHIARTVDRVTIKENQDAVTVSGPIMEAAFNVALCIASGLFGYLEGGSQGAQPSAISIPSLLREAGKRLHDVKVQEHQHHNAEVQKNVIHTIRCYKSLLEGNMWQRGDDSPSLLAKVSCYLNEKPLLRHILLNNNFTSSIEHYRTHNGFEDPSWTLSTIPPVAVTYLLQHPDGTSTGLYMSPEGIVPLLNTVALCTITQERKLCGSPFSGTIPWQPDALRVPDEMYIHGTENLIRGVTTLAERLWNVWDLVPGLYESGIDALEITDHRDPDGVGEISFAVPTKNIHHLLKTIQNTAVPYPSEFRSTLNGELAYVITIPATHATDNAGAHPDERRCQTTVLRPAAFLDWLTKLGAEEREAVTARLERIESKGLGALGYTRGIGLGLSELKFKIGGGLRVYYHIRRDASVPVFEIRGWGNKDSQQVDIDHLR